MILPNILDSNFAHIFTGIGRVVREQGYTTTLYTSAEVPAEENAIIERICRQRMDGVVLVSCQPENSLSFKKFREMRFN